jgi:hypothetical protein
MILVRSSGATQVLAKPPAAPPASSSCMTICNLSLFGVGCVLWQGRGGEQASLPMRTLAAAVAVPGQACGYCCYRCCLETWPSLFCLSQVAYAGNLCYCCSCIVARSGQAKAGLFVKDIDDQYWIEVRFVLLRKLLPRILGRSDLLLLKLLLKQQ